MILDFQNIENIAIALPITSDSRKIANNFASQQFNQQKAEQIFLNTLAVLTVKNYLDLLGIPTNLAGSDSWDPVMRICDNVADLDIFELGKLECRPVRSADSSCHIPMEVWDLRLGYVIVKIDDSFKNAKLLGFVPQVTTEELTITDLRPIEALIDHLHDVKELTFTPPLVNLDLWLHNIFTAGWKTVESLLNPEQLTLNWGFRNTELTPENSLESENIENIVQRAKLIDLGIQLRDRQVVLLVEINPELKDKIAVTLQVHPRPNDAYLPEALILKVIESSGEVFMQAQSRSQDNFIQLQFSGQKEERFTVKIILDNAELTEQFQL
ncbi:DUF1822 family protein [Pleurocapsa sp. PCC 7319]|uniref:DUF1822 family protein n=1 Tax=Pleurocapsa sp. PCC 7319 TaxID=118161 RepID=UPI000345FC05|nr:DUF1822 family protein [Pleurocapsa sp. PCC 7319]